MSDVVNLRRVRKDRARRRRENEAEANRLAFGRTKSERLHSDASEAVTHARLDAHRLEPAPSRFESSGLERSARSDSDLVCDDRKAREHPSEAKERAEQSRHGGAGPAGGD